MKASRSSHSRDLTPGIDLSDAFFIQADKFVATGSVSTTNLNVGLKAGFLGAQVVAGRVALDGRIKGTLNDPNGDGRITVGELASAGSDTFSNLTPTGTLDVTLPVQATVGGRPLSTATGDARPTIVIKDDNLFGGGAPSFEARNFEDLLNFSNVTPESFLALLQQLEGWLAGFGDAGVFGTHIPFTADKTLGDVVDLGRAFTDQLVGLLESPDGTPNYATVQDLTQRIIARLGGDPSHVRYDATTNLLTFDVTLSELFAPAPAAIAFDVGLDPLAKISSSSQVNVGGGVTLDATFGIDLSPLRADTTPDNPLDDDSLTNHFFIQDASLTGSAQVSAADIDASAKVFDFVDIGVVSVQVRSAPRWRFPQDPNTQAGTDGRITLPEPIVRYRIRRCSVKRSSMASRISSSRSPSNLPCRASRSRQARSSR
jgi:hypothetical protein